MIDMYDIMLSSVKLAYGASPNKQISFPEYVSTVPLFSLKVLLKHETLVIINVSLSVSSDEKI